MNHLLIIIIVILLLIIFALLAKVYFLCKSAQEITEAFRDRLTADTNTLIDISARDPYMRKLAAEINTQLRLLRKERHRYQNGDRELKEAVTNISHDLRTPLTAICGYLELLERTEKTLEQKRYLMLISQRAEAMKELTQELLRYSVAVSGGEELRLEPVDLDAALEDAVASIYGVLVDREIVPRVSLPEKRVVRNLDRAALSRVLGNLLSNAVKYSGGDLDIALDRDGTITLSNAAPYMDEIQVGRLFDRFFTVEAARSSTGLGLSIAKSLTERMGGTISARYKDGRLTISCALNNGI